MVVDSVEYVKEGLLMCGVKEGESKRVVLRLRRGGRGGVMSEGSCFHRE